jgi:hypothetical protein
VDVADVMVVARRWRCRSGEACYDPRYDADGDDQITVVDMMHVARGWGKMCTGANVQTW